VTRTPLSLPLIAFGMTHGGKSLLWSGMDALSLFVLIKVVDIPPAVAGAIFVLSSLWNAVVDGAWGQAIDRAPRIRAMLPVLCTLALIVACLSFAALPWLARGSTLAAATALVLFRTAFSLVDVPHNMTASALVADHGHLVIARWRTVLGSLAAVAIAIAVLPMMGSDRAAAGAAPIMLLAIAIGGGLLLAPLPWLLRATRGDAPMPQPAATTATLRWPHQGLILFCLLQMLGFAALASTGKAILHVDATHRWVLDYALLLLTFGRLASIGLWSALAGRLGTARALGCAYAVNALAVLTLPLAIPQGAIGTILALALLGTATGGIALLVWTSLSELVSQLEQGHGQAMAARGYGWFTATSKIGLGLSGFLTGAWLSGQSGALTGQALWPLVEIVAMLCLAVALLGWPGWPGWIGRRSRSMLRRLQPA
jgi:GPH family glycoside/pentoside/hexuronide:cation symporter